MIYSSIDLLQCSIVQLCCQPGTIVMFENQPHDLAWEYDFFVSDVTPKHLTSAKQSCVPLFEWKSSCQPQGSCSSIRVEKILSASRLIFLYSSGDNHVSLRAHVPLIRVETANAHAHRDIPWNRETLVGIY